MEYRAAEDSADEPNTKIWKRAGVRRLVFIGQSVSSNRQSSKDAVFALRVLTEK